MDENFEDLLRFSWDDEDTETIERIRNNLKRYKYLISSSTKTDINDIILLVIGLKKENHELKNDLKK